MADHKIGLKDAIQAAYDELHQAITEIPVYSNLNFVYRSIDLEFTVEVTQAVDTKAGVRVWVVEAGAGASQQRTNAHVVKVSIEPRGDSGLPDRISGGDSGKPATISGGTFEDRG